MRTATRAALVLMLGAMASVLVSCSGGSTAYSSPESLKDSYVEAGGSCGKPLEVGEDMLSEGAHGFICESMTFLIVFDSEDAKNRYVARTGSAEVYAVGGDRWLASGDDRDVLDKLGGRPIE